MSEQLRTVEGGCHCGAVRFAVRLPAVVQVVRCNCSICRMTGFEHVTVRHEDFALLQGKGSLKTYCFNTGEAKHLFCENCGIKSFYQPRSHPGAWSIHRACLELPDDVVLEFRSFDGANWEEHVEDLRKHVP